jgi:transcriptional regulator with XRE-family HTH domain
VRKKQANAIDAHVGNRVRLRRVTVGMSQEKLGQLLGLTFQQVQKYEKGINRIGAGRLFELARILGVGILYFYDGLAEELASRPLGFAEDQGPAPHPPSTAEGLQLQAAFNRIPDPRLRRRILELVKEIAADAATRGK